MFDAGTIEARLTLNTSAFGRDLDLARARVKAFEDERHEVKISAVFDTASMSKAKQIFGQLDQSISREAMQRLRSSPQGSVLGALNALFSPHQVTGAPTAQQAGQQGLLGQMISGQGGGIGNASTGNRAANGPAQTVRQVLTGTSPSNTSTTDTVRQKLVGNGPSDVTTTDTIRQRVVGNGPGDVSTTDTVRIKVDKASAAKAEADAKASGDRAGSGWSGSFGKHVSNLFSTLFGPSGTNSNALKALDIAGGGSGDLSGSLGKNLVGAAGPGIGKLSFKAGSIIGLGGAALGAVPSLLGVGGTALGAGLGAGVLALGFKGVQSQISPVSQAYQQAKTAQAAATTPQQIKAAAQQMAGVQQQIKALDPALQQVFKAEQQIQNTWQGITAGMAPLFARAMTGVSSLLTSLAPSLKNLFGAAGTLITPLLAGLSDLGKTVLPPLAGVLKATAPLLRPLLDGLGQLAGPLLSGLTVLLRASMPAITAFGSALGTLGKDLGALFADAAPVMKASSIILKDLLDVVSGLFPIIGKLAQIFASGLAPVFNQFSKILQSLLPFLVQVGSVLADLAGATLSDLVGLLGALATVVKVIAPSFTVLAGALGNVFTILENSSVFEILANAIENMAGPLGKFVAALVTGLVPILPPVIMFIGQIASILATQLASAVTALLPPLSTLVLSVLQVLADILPAILPALTTFVTLFTQYALVDTISGIAKALNVVLNLMPPAVLGGIVVGILGVVGALKAWQAATVAFTAIQAIFTAALDFDTIALKAMYAWDVIMAVATKAWAVAQAVLDVALDASVIGLIVIAVAALAAGIVALVTHWTTVWSTIKSVTNDAWHWLDSNVLQPMINWFTQSLPHAFDLVTSALHTAWTAISNWFHQWWYVVLLGVFTGGLGLIAGLLIKYWGTITSNVHSYWNTIVAFFKGVPGAILANINAAGGQLLKWGASIMTDMFNGIKSIWDSIVNFFKGLPGAILHALGINSPPKWAIQAGKDIMQGLGIGMSAAHAKVAATAASLAKLSANAISVASAGIGGNIQALMQQMAAAKGWTGSQWAALNAVEMAEAGYSLTATNPGSGAYGLAQFINGPSEYAQYGGNANTAAGQITGMLNYIAQRYGTPAAAWQHEQQFHWYGKGGPIDEPVLGWGVNSGDRYVLGESGREWVVPDARMGHGGGDNSAIVGRLDKLIDTAAQIPAGVGRHVGSTLNNAAEAASFRNRYPQGGW